MVKMKRSKSKKRYLRGKSVYNYLRFHFPVPRKFLKKLEPYFKEDFQTELTDDDGKIALTYTFYKKPKAQ
ncbi:MAG TPA: hypothetical protein VK536_01775 [Candidatus Limnocylindrales bacterium]|nr:hypothetical protein [Candidatus Limnocylindrales bacterium]